MKEVREGARGLRQRIKDINQGLSNPRRRASVDLTWNGNWEMQARTSMQQNKRCEADTCSTTSMNAETLTFGGKKPRMPGVGDHELKQLADAAGVAVSAEEAALLQRLSPFVKFAGRYPIPTTPEQMKPSRHGTAPGFVSGEKLELAEQRAARLMREVEPWRYPNIWISD